MFEDLFNASSAGGFGSIPMDQADDLVKTLTMGHANGTAAPGSLSGGAALQMESVDGQLKSNTLSRRDLVFWPSVPQDRAYSLSEQYNRTNSYGDEGSPYIPESGSPAMNDSNYDRHNQKVVFLSTRRGVSIASQFVRTLGNINAEAAETQGGTMWLLEKLERELYKGLADFSNAGYFDGSLQAIPIKLQNLALAGVEQQIRAGNTDFTAQIRAFDGYGGNQTVITSLNDVLDETTIDNQATLQQENGGHVTMLDLAPRNLHDFIAQFYPKERVNALGTLDGRAGYVVRTLATTAGDVAMRPNVFLRPKLGPKQLPDREGCPGAPAALTNNAAQSIVSGSGFYANQSAGTTSFAAGDLYTYTVTSANEQGEGNQYLTSTTVTVSAAGNYITFKISDPSSGATPTHFAVYRTINDGASSIAGPTTPAFIGYVVRSGTGVTLFTDQGAKQPGAATAYLFDIRPETVVWRQLAPMLKIAQGTLGSAREFLLWLAGTIILFQPRFHGVFENIVRAA